ncbi:HlyD family secretion protein [Rhizobium sp. SL86]|uniref:HlyD family secretion protein n=1 Tax=Rhizobium sp. SL86 TaxID=2995148 RepID=UPI0022723C3E|nr:HlyD family efflux transporter periplasmic adaptor subunit [Rhizobium sp. SL86]MCY1667607.1 efflux RND transporter periplasmic adaptor subunit [Rhizobium sp. SL86]
MIFTASRTSASFAVFFVTTATAIALFQDAPARPGIAINPVVTGTTVPVDPLFAQGDGEEAARIVAGLGVVEPLTGATDVASGMVGVLASVLADEGDRVRRGQVLAELFNDDLKARVAQAEATLQIKRAQLAMIEKGPRQQEILQAEAQVREEESNLKLLNLQFERRRTLAAQGAVSREEVNQVASSLSASRERRASAIQALLILRDGSRPEEVDAARGEVALAENQLAEARAAVEKSYVRAPIDGIVLRRYREPGEAITSQAAASVMQIADISRLIVRTQIDEADIAALAVGQTATISAAAFGERKLTGTVQRISPRLGAKTITAEGPTEKRDTRVLDVIVALPENIVVPINLRVDVLIDVSSAPTTIKPELRGTLQASPETLALFQDIDPIDMIEEESCVPGHKPEDAARTCPFASAPTLVDPTQTGAIRKLARRDE